MIIDLASDSMRLLPSSHRQSFLHPPLCIDRFESELLVQPMCILGSQAPAPHGLQSLMVQQSPKHALGDALALISWYDEDITEPSEAGIVRNDSGEPYLLTAVECSDDKAIGDGPLQNFATYSRRPVRLAQKAVDHIDLHALWQKRNLYAHRERVYRWRALLGSGRWQFIVMGALLGRALREQV